MSSIAVESEGISESLSRYSEILDRYFGHSNLTRVQQQVLTAYDEGSNVFAVSPTGSGKSMLYTLPAIRYGKVVVVSPHISLMHDQVENLQTSGVAASYINSTLNRSQKNSVFESFKSGATKLIFVSPELLSNERFVSQLGDVGVSLLAIDEAHCVSEWGHTFRPNYLRLAEARKAINPRRTLATTATATAKVRSDILQRLEMTDADTISTSIRRTNLAFQVEVAGSNEEKKEFVVNYTLARKGKSGIVYASSRQSCEDLAELMHNSDVSAVAYHAGLDSSQRTRIQRSFMRDQVDVIVATNAFGLGINKPDVRFVVHYDMPQRLESYYQEAGRAGRDGDAADCVLVHTRWSRQAPQYFIDRDHPSMDDVLELWNDILDGEYVDREGLDELQHNDGWVMAVRALRESGLLASDSLSARSEERVPNVRMDSIRSHKSYEEELLDQMDGYGKSARCRIEFILSYFGELDGETCGVCDNCTQTNGSLARSAKSRRRSQSDLLAQELNEDDLELFERLKEWRKERADRDSVPAFVVFHDRVLATIAGSRPISSEELQSIGGIGTAKAGRYGSDILELVKAYGQT